jgi:cob(I)alamin adenosyltransferase
MEDYKEAIEISLETALQQNRIDAERIKELIHRIDTYESLLKSMTNNFSNCKKEKSVLIELIRELILK